MPSAHYVHPEFGYFCPGPGLRRVLRVAVVSILFGIIIEASVIRLRAGHDRQADNGIRKVYPTGAVRPSLMGARDLSDHSSVGAGSEGLTIFSISLMSSC